MQKLIVKPVNKELCKISVEDRPSAKGEVYWPTEMGTEALERVYHHFKSEHVASTLYAVKSDEAVHFIETDPELGKLLSAECEASNKPIEESVWEEAGVLGMYILGGGLVIAGLALNAFMWVVIVVAATLFLGNKR